jgi:hypothetical protein
MRERAAGAELRYLNEAANKHLEPFDILERAADVVFHACSSYLT